MSYLSPHTALLLSQFRVADAERSARHRLLRCCATVASPLTAAAAGALARLFPRTAPRAATVCCE